MHMREVHQDVKPAECYECELKFKRTENLKRHMKRAHTKSKNVKKCQCLILPRGESTRE